MTKRSRKYIFHYHLFKNAGTSVDYVLKKSFPNLWDSREFDGSRERTNVEVLEWIGEKNDFVCFSTHTYIGQIPTIEKGLCIPIIFIRHPVDRIASVYEYERKQIANGYGPEMAKRLSFVDYVKERNLIDKQVLNFHLHRLSSIAGICPEVEGVLKFFKTLPFIGVVDEFQKSMAQLNNVLVANKLGCLELDLVYENVNRDVFSGLDSRLKCLREEVGGDFYNYLCEINAPDLFIYEYAKNQVLSSAM